jgi:HEAT repeat protein
MAELRETAPPHELAHALDVAANPHTRQLLADLLAGSVDGVPALAAALDDPVRGVRASAADSLGKVFLAHPAAPGREAAGAALLARWHREPEASVKQMLAAALGATRYEPAREVLEAATRDAALRDPAAWALTALPRR